MWHIPQKSTEVSKNYLPFFETLKRGYFGKTKEKRKLHFKNETLQKKAELESVNGKMIVNGWNDDQMMGEDRKK